MSRNTLVAVAFIPSAFGFVSWTICLALYESRLMGWFPGTAESFAVFVAVSVCFAASAAVHFPAYRQEVDRLFRSVAASRPDSRTFNVPAWLLWILHAIGLVGLTLYIKDILLLFGGWNGLYSVLLSETHLVRGADFDLIGIYLSYCGWMAIPLTILKWKVDKRLAFPLVAILVAQILGNLLFIDRTRPVWIGFVSILVLFPFMKRPSLGRLLMPLGAVGILGVVAFYAIGFWVGKTGEAFPYYGDVRVPYEVGALLYYLTSGFAYFEAVWQEAMDITFVPERTLYPLYKALSILGFANEPTPQILPVLDLPFPANVGTFLEPLLSDGGPLYLLPGILFATFAIDSIALHCLRMRNSILLFFWANLCFTSFISFFVPKLPSTPVWLFGTFAAVTALFIYLRAHQPKEEEEDVVVVRPRPVPELEPDRAPMAGDFVHLGVVPALATPGGPREVPGFEIAIPFLDRAAPDAAVAVTRTYAANAIHDRIRVLFLTRYGPQGPSSRVRALQFFESLDLQGVSCHAAPLLTGEYLRHRFEGSIPMSAVIPGYARRIRDLVNARHFHVVWLEKELFPFLPAAFEGLERIAGRPLVVDYDDAIFERYREHSSGLVRSMLGTKIDHVMRRADLVTAGNEYIAAHARHAGAKQVEILPSVVDTIRYPVLQRPADAPFTIGWIGSPSTAPYLDLVRPVLERAVKELHARVRVIGGGEKALAGMKGVDRLQWHEATEGQDVAMIDVGIMPLADTPWERGKCGYKLVQYMAAARPVIASPVGVNATLVEHGKDGFLATTEEEWFAALQALASSRELRDEMGMVGRAKVEHHYSVAAIAPRFAALLRGLAG